TLRLVLDTLGMTFDAVKGFINEVSGLRSKGGGIKNPTFLEGEELQIAKARVVAAWLSDGHVAYYDKVKTGSSTYAEASPGRIKQFKKTLRLFGEVYYNEKATSGTDMKTAVFPKIWTDMLISWGLHQGDKTVLNPGIPDFVRNGSDSVKIAYLEELVCEDGSVSTHGGSFKVSIVRASLLRAGSRSKKYGVSSKVSNKHVKFIIKHGKYSKFLKGRHVSWKKLKDLKNSDDPNDSSIAAELMILALENRNRLLDDELDIAGYFGIGMTPFLTSVNYYERTGRVTVSWKAETNSVEDATRWGLIATPNDTRKRAIMKKALSVRDDLVSRLKDEISPEWTSSEKAEV
ncbi:MAG: hypothetical protein P1Q69_19595, partial [Candidatus Thorarchaeota archaeon]|nr:hypothetical protein [Candidatus Thorarchaeota archaeon]